MQVDPQTIGQTAPTLQMRRSAQDATAFEMNDMDVLTVWRANGPQAVAKVDALATNGMDDFEIPAFLRKQTESGSRTKAAR